MRQVGWALLAALTLTAPAGSQTPARPVERAKVLYEALELERAVAVLRGTLSPDSLTRVTPQERADAYRYLGASLALMGHADSAVHYFHRALEWDPFADLSPALFTPAQIQLFAEARRRTFEVGVRRAPTTRVDPRTEAVEFTVVTTHRAEITAQLTASGDRPGAILYAGPSTGLRVLRWNGLLSDGRLAPPGRYRLGVAARSGLIGRRDTALVYFDLRHDVEPLEDTLPALTAADLVPSRYSERDAAGDLAKGAAAAAAALIVSEALANRSLGRARTGPQIVAGVALATGVVAWLVRRRHPDNPGAAMENERRREQRDAANGAIRARNAERVARTRLLIEPAAGEEQQ